MRKGTLCAVLNGNGRGLCAVFGTCTKFPSVAFGAEPQCSMLRAYDGEEGPDRGRVHLRLTETGFPFSAE